MLACRSRGVRSRRVRAASRRGAGVAGRPESPAKRRQTLRRALALWRGQPFADFRYEPFAQAEIARLEELRLSCLEARIDADLALGRHAELVGELEALTREQPLRQRPRAQLMLALYRSGRHADALDVYQTTRRHLVEELGIEPSGELRELHQAILRQDAELELPRHSRDRGDARGAPRARTRAPAVAPAVARKTVTVLVAGRRRAARPRPSTRSCDAGSASARSTESLRCSSATAPRVERLGDDRVMGVFGVPGAHEDDALRAVRAAVELRDGPRSGTPLRIGIDTGEVLTGDAGAGSPSSPAMRVDSARRSSRRATAAES